MLPYSCLSQFSMKKGQEGMVTGWVRDFLKIGIKKTYIGTEVYIKSPKTTQRS